MDEYWTMKDGKEIAVGDMTEEHAKNCLRLLMRRVDRFNNGRLMSIPDKYNPRDD